MPIQLMLPPILLESKLVHGLCVAERTATSIFDCLLDEIGPPLLLFQGRRALASQVEMLQTECSAQVDAAHAKLLESDLAVKQSQAQLTRQARGSCLHPAGIACWKHWSPSVAISQYHTLMMSCSAAACNILAFFSSTGFIACHASILRITSCGSTDVLRVQAHRTKSTV